ncbi:LuxR C-terminal-related transcriptional regulator [Kitasatospora sp. NPDC056783]|uniref:LuxR C-terminal-related transcriptional regulator n=1 Tax=Kitasatospora sp. NPDC056783 TaxID=3345943 RepID=UPI0036B6EAF3
MTAPGTGAGLLPVVQEPRVRKCGHYLAEDLTRHEALVLAHLVSDLNAIEIADAVNAMPERRGSAAMTPDTARGHLESLRHKAKAQTWPQLVDTACRMRLLLPPRARLTKPLPESAMTSLQLLVDGLTNRQVATMRGISANTVGKHLEEIRHRVRTRGTPAAVFRLHGVPDVLDDTCPICGEG